MQTLLQAQKAQNPQTATTAAIITAATTATQQSTKAQPLRIYEIQGSNDTSAYNGQSVITEGIVTAVFQQLRGFYIQDTAGDADINTSDAIFVYNNTQVQAGNYVQISGTVSEYSNQTQISSASVSILKNNCKIPYTCLNFPTDFPENRETMEGMIYVIPHRMYIMGTSNLERYGQLNLSSKLLRAATDQALPLSEEYHAALHRNTMDNIILDDASTTINPSPTPYAAPDGSLRTSRYTDTLICIMGQQSQRYMLYPAKTPVFHGNSRTSTPDETLLGDYNLKVCGFNLEHFTNESELQKTRLTKAITAIDADIYGFCEVQKNNNIIQALVDAMNEAKGCNVYTYIPLHSTSAINEVVQIVYRKDKVSPYKNSYKISTGVTDRKFIQAFKTIYGGDIFAFSINHFKAKSGTGTGLNADQGDGQGIFNHDRKLEAEAVLAQLEKAKQDYGTERVLIMGDLNAMHCEDPIMIFRNAGYKNLTNIFDSNMYSYRFNNVVQYLDYSLASDSLAQFVTGAIAWHINSDEPSSLSYDNNPSTELYRCSDHDPIIVGLRLPSTFTTSSEIKTPKQFSVYPNPTTDLITINCPQPIEEISIFSATGKCVLKQGDETSVDLSSLPKGLYIIRIATKNGDIFTQKISKI
ncbi:MAG: ExeM/NucH family extracellular endonuclease [Bacteroidales bacterium]|nr:ExeM/NucH family extracellular endonuclease [Bacteroidales bacterium]